MSEETTKYPRIVFGLEMGAAGAVCDIKPDLVLEALRHGGIKEKDIEDIPVIVRASDDLLVAASAHFAHPANDGKPAIELHSYKGVGAITAPKLAHEAKHVAEMIYEGRSAFVSKKMGYIRKIAATSISLAIGSYIFMKSGVDIMSNDTDPALLITEVALTDMVLCNSLIVEYFIRKHERHAFRAMMGVKNENILTFGTKVAIPKLTLAKLVLKTIFIPNFKL